ncbi:MAG: carbon starvation CstA family protein [Verrucomicrobiales bacterium]
MTREIRSLAGPELWESLYSDWTVASTTAIGAFVVGAANFLEAIDIDHGLATALIGVLVASFAGTTLDTAIRLQRYVIQELAATFAPKISPTALAAEGYDTEFDRGQVVKSRSWHPLTWRTNAHRATVFAVVTAFGLSLFPKPGDPWTWATIGKGGLILSPLFGATNQLLGGLSFLVVTFWLWRRKLPIWSTAVPMVFMLVLPAWALTADLARWWEKDQFLLVGVAVLMLGLELWMIVEALLLWPQANGVLEKALTPITSNRVSLGRAG